MHANEPVSAHAVCTGWLVGSIAGMEGSAGVWAAAAGTQSTQSTQQQQQQQQQLGGADGPLAVLRLQGAGLQLPLVLQGEQARLAALLQVGLGDGGGSPTPGRTGVPATSGMGRTDNPVRWSSQFCVLCSGFCVLGSAGGLGLRGAQRPSAHSPSVFCVLWVLWVFCGCWSLPLTPRQPPSGGSRPFRPTYKCL